MLFVISDGLRNIPSVDKVVSDLRIKQISAIYPFDLIVDTVRSIMEKERILIKEGQKSSTFDEIINSVINQLDSYTKPNLRPVINATGVILHTNLGRAPLSKATMRAMELASQGYSNLEFDLEKGDRGSRNEHLEKLLCQLTGAEAALVVNNNAAAVVLVLSALAKRKEVIVSRGEAVEIGGGFRIPDVMRQSGAKLVEVGTTNCTYSYDYEQAITDRTAALLRVHPSNFSVAGFTHRVTLQEMVAAAHQKNIIVIDDLGSGCFLETERFGLFPEPTIPQSVGAGAEVICFSGDKLIGGPQAGIIIGRKLFVDKLKKHPLARAMRVDKSRLSGLWATLLHYLKGEAEKEIPVWQMISMPLAEITNRAQNWTLNLKDKVEIIDGKSMIGGGSLPGETLPTKLLAIGINKKSRIKNVNSLSQEFRRQETPIICRIDNDLLLLDPRTVLPEEDEKIVAALKNIADLL